VKRALTNIIIASGAVALLCRLLGHFISVSSRKMKIDNEQQTVYTDMAHPYETPLLCIEIQGMNACWAPCSQVCLMMAIRTSLEQLACHTHDPLSVVRANCVCLFPGLSQVRGS
jgi:hypothetical protein